MREGTVCLSVVWGRERGRKSWLKRKREEEIFIECRPEKKPPVVVEDTFPLKLGVKPNGRGLVSEWKEWVFAVALCGEKGVPRGRKEHGGKIRGGQRWKVHGKSTVLVPVLVPGIHHDCPHRASGFYGCCSELQSQINYDTLIESPHLPCWYSTSREKSMV